MNALDVIPLEDAKKYLAVEEVYHDEMIERLIGTAVSMVEEYTNHYLYRREKSYTVTGECLTVPDYPFFVSSVTARGLAVEYELRPGTLSSYIYAPRYASVRAEVGYDSISDAPQPLVEAAYKLLVYLYDNRDVYEVGLPRDIQVMINSFRRSSSI